jgi:hypothetical protein
VKHRADWGHGRWEGNRATAQRESNRDQDDPDRAEGNKDGVGIMEGVCLRDGCGQQYNKAVNDGDHCMACEGEDILLAGIDPGRRCWRPSAESLSGLPPHEVTEVGADAAGQRYARLRYSDGSEGLIDPIPWDEEIGAAPEHLIPLRTSSYDR